jgi:hypothetical protein
MDGRHRAAVPFVKDKVEALYERPPQQVWTAAKDVLRYNGTLVSDDTLRATLEAVVSQRRVWVHVDPVDARVTRVRVQVRTRGGGTDMEMAGEIDKQIAIRLATGNLTPATRAAPGR